MHKFHKVFNDRASQMVLQLEATKRRLEGARVQVHVQNALLKLACMGELWGRFYWTGLLGLLEHPNQHYLPSLCGACTIMAQGVEVKSDKRRNTGDQNEGTTIDPQAIPCTTNIC
jgi:hypothetical protein